MAEDKAISAVMDRLSEPDGFAYYLSLSTAPAEILTLIGAYCQLAAAIDLHLRRIYFGLISSGGENIRGKERATLDQLLERLPRAVDRTKVELNDKQNFVEWVADVGFLLQKRNDVVHSFCRWIPDRGILVFAHANETAGRAIRTGDDISYWFNTAANLHKVVRLLDLACNRIPFFEETWLPVLRPWLDSSPVPK